MHSRIGVRLFNNYHKLFHNRLCILSDRNRHHIGSLSGGNVGEKKFDTIKHLTLRLAKIMGVKTGYKPVPPDRSYLLKYLPKRQEDLPPRSMQDSFLIAFIPLSSDGILQDKYITFLGHVRLGRLLEDMDIFAVMVAQKHIFNPNHPENVPSPYTLVTALVDKIDFSDFVPKPREDIKLSGHVSWVGKSSMEIIVWLEQSVHGSWKRITKALFLIVARDPTNQSAAIINPMKPANDREEEIFSGGELRKKNRLIVASKHLSKVIPSEEEQILIHNLYIRSTDKGNMRKRRVPVGCTWMGDCKISNVIFLHPENRNLHSTIFGGFIMRQAEELSWIAGYMYSKYRPVLKSMSDIHFFKAIAVNSLVQMYAYVVYSKLNYFQTTVYAETYDPGTGVNNTTNTFHFTYEVPEVVPEVFPDTYREAMMYIDGRRHFIDVMNRPSKETNITMLNENAIKNKL